MSTLTESADDLRLTRGESYTMETPKWNCPRHGPTSNVFSIFVPGCDARIICAHCVLVALDNLGLPSLERAG